MARTGEIANLFATLGFQVDTKALDGFMNKLDAVEQKLKQMRSEFAKPLKLDIQVGRVTKKTISDALKDLRLSISKVNLPRHLVNEALNTALTGGAKIHFRDVKINSGTLKAALKETAKDAVLNIGKVQVSRKAMQDAVDAAATNIRLKIVNVGIDEAKLRASLEAALHGFKGTIAPRVAGGAGNAAGGAAGAHRMAFGGGMVGGALSNIGGLVGGAATAYGVVGLNQMNQELQAIPIALEAVTGSSEEAAKKLEMLNKMGAEMGKTMRDLAPMYTQILAATRGTAMESETDNVFKGFMKYGTVMGLDSEAMKGSFRAISQMVSKQQVYAEELRGQLAERLPAAVRIAAEVMTGGDTKALNKMMEEGKLDPNELLPKMAKYMEEMANKNDAYAKSLETSRVAQGRFNWQFEQTVKLFAASGFDRGMKVFFDTLSRGLKENEAFVIAFGSAFEWAMEQLGKLGSFIKVILKEIQQFGEGLGLTNEQMIVLSGIIGGLLMPWTRLFTIIGLTLVALEDFYGFTQGKDSLFGRWFSGLSKEDQESLKTLASTISELVTNLGKLSGMVLEGWIQLWNLFQDSGGLGATADRINSVAEAINNLIDALVELKEKGSVSLPTAENLEKTALDTFTSFGPAALGKEAFDFVYNFAKERQQLSQAQPVVQQALTIPSITIDMTDAVIGSKQEADIIGKAIADQFMMELNNLRNDQSAAAKNFADKGA